ncbi:glycosyltransferase [Umezawaea sp. Da 62-37]|uniref:glycosyltransferase n=1 Tax=Umezawaea sp. Da 62-37 TaxID=3075927 RepID=UPI0028F6E028|nr:glycosyltransferase [Umezawaea sp. Da 62-37]WNV87671.1 glycosyltransferase [Umezawaea sp. Da 62-37]
MTGTRREPIAVSVVIPAHNRATALRNGLRSLRTQSLPRGDFEVVVVDDGSEPPLSGEIAEFVDGGHVRVIRHDSARGAGAARNTGAAAARGELLVFLDVDCLCHPDLLSAHVEAQAGGPVAVCGFSSGREITPAAWRLALGEDWDFTDAEATFARATGTPALHDPLTELLADPRPADWAFFWTLNVGVPKSAFDLVGGFNRDFEVKGCEDLELGYRLAKAGFPTVFAPKAITIHQPHERDRNTEIARDRRNEHVLVRAYPSVEVEAVCSYDIANSRDLVPAIERFAAGLVTRASDCAHLGRLPQLVDRVAAGGPVLLVGAPTGWPPDLPAPEAVCFPRDVDDVGQRQHLRLLGTRLPVEDKHFELGVLTDYWRQFPERTVSRILAEMHRTCRDVLVLTGVSRTPAERPDQDLAAALAAHDHPYWEFTVRLRRELHQFDLAEWERGALGTSAFRCPPIDWPTTELGATASP